MNLCTIRTAAARAFNFALPSHCALCGNLSQHVVCPGCNNAYWHESAARCARCAIPLPLPWLLPQHDGRMASVEDPGATLPERAVSAPAECHLAVDTADTPRGPTSASFCGTCMATPPAYDATIALAHYEAPLDSLALALKFHARLALADDFARRLASRMCDMARPASPAMPDLIMPVPLSARRLAERGYNQAWQIARPLARRLGVPARAAAMVRTLDTPPQARLDAQARHRNLRQAFALRVSVAGRHIGVVDDVMTSGATLQTLADILKRAGAARVTNLVVFRTAKNWAHHV